MRQSTIIFGTLLFTFIVYITLRGQMPQYLALFTSKKAAPQATSTASSGGGKSLADQANDAVKAGERFSNMFGLSL